MKPLRSFRSRSLQRARRGWFLAIAPILCLSIPSAHAARSTKSLEEGGIQIHLDFPADATVGSIHVTAKVEALPAMVWSTMVDINHWDQWMPLVKESWFYSAAAVQAIPEDVTKDAKIFSDLRAKYPGRQGAPSANGKSARVAYEYYDLPWPIKNVWLVRHYQFDASHAGAQSYRATWRKSYDRKIHDSEGYWNIEPFPGAPGATLMTYHFSVKPKHGLALALFKTGVQRTVRRLIIAVRKETAARAVP